MEITLNRTESGPNGTFGTLTVGSETFHTAERPWVNNRPRVSCIPKGKFPCTKHGWNGEAVKFRQVWEINEVPGRDAILIHAGNLPLSDSVGCLLPGTARGSIDGMPAVIGSRAAIERLREILPQKFWLKVEGVVG